MARAADQRLASGACAATRDRIGVCVAAPAKRALVRRQDRVPFDDSASIRFHLNPAHALAALGPQLDRIKGRRLSDGTASGSEIEVAVLCIERSYHFCLACRVGKPVGYLAARGLTPRSSRQLGHNPNVNLGERVLMFDINGYQSA